LHLSCQRFDHFHLEIQTAIPFSLEVHPAAHHGQCAANAEADNAAGGWWKISGEPWDFIHGVNGIIGVFMGFLWDVNGF